MGTSQSSRGAPSGVPMVPPWVEDSPGNGDPTPQGNPEAQPQETAPRGRFGPSRTSLGRYALSGSSDDMRRGLGHYVNKGLGGASTAARRFSGTARTAGSLYSAFATSAGGRVSEAGSPFDPVLLRGRSANEIMDALVEAVRPSDGTQDGEASRDSIKSATSELLDRFPEANLLNLTEDQRLFVIERYVASDVDTRFELDVSKSIIGKAPTITDGLARLKEIRDFIKQEVSAAFRSLITAGEQLSAQRITSIVNQALQVTFHVFEDYVK